MAYPTQSVQARRIYYHGLAQPIGTVAYEDSADWDAENAIQDPVMTYDPYTTITGYVWDFYLKMWVSNPE